MRIRFQMTGRMKDLFVLILFLSMLSQPYRAWGAEGDSMAGRTGRFTLAFQERHPLGDRTYKGEYDLSDETFSAYVPPTYDDTKPYGLWVWVSPGNQGGPLKAYEPVLDTNEMIWIGGNAIGNERPAVERIGLSLDAVYHMQRMYRIDPERIYIGGFSGGGRVSSMAIFLYPEVFAGGCYVMGCNFYRDLIVQASQQEIHIPGFSPGLNDALLRQAWEKRFVFMTAEKDFNRNNTNLVLRAYKSEGVKHATYIEIPDWDHRMPPAEWLDRGIVALDRPLRVCREASPDTGDVVARVRTLLESRPAQALELLERIEKEARGRPEHGEIRGLFDSLLEDEDVQSLAEIRREIRAFHQKLCEEGTGRATMTTVLQLTEKIETFLDSEPSEALVQEARSLISEI